MKTIWHRLCCWLAGSHVYTAVGRSLPVSRCQWCGKVNPAYWS